jgi:hypothetical protein
MGAGALSEDPRLRDGHRLQPYARSPATISCCSASRWRLTEREHAGQHPRGDDVGRRALEVTAVAAQRDTVEPSEALAVGADVRVEVEQPGPRFGHDRLSQLSDDDRRTIDAVFPPDAASGERYADMSHVDR